MTRWFVYGLIATIVIGVMVLSLLLVGGRMAWVSFLSLTGRSSWQMVWALLDGNLRTGILVAPSGHFDPAIAPPPVGNPARIPAWVTLCAFALIYGLIFSKARLRESPCRFEFAVAGAAFLFAAPGVELCQPGRVAGNAFARAKPVAISDSTAAYRTAGVDVGRNGSSKLEA